VRALLTSINKNKKLLNFYCENKEELNNPIIKNFLKNEDNFKLLTEAVLTPSKRNRESVDKVFREYYLKVKKVKYVSNLIYFFSIDFDKKQRKYQSHNSLILDKSLSNETETTLKDFIPDKEQSNNQLFGTRLIDHIENETLAEALKTLTKRQLQVLELIYLKGLTLKEISFITDSTPQNISNHHRKALIKLYDKLRNRGV